MPKEVGISMGTSCASPVADLFLFCYERDFMMSLSDDKQAHVIDAVYTTSLLRQRLSEPEFYGDLVYKWKKIVCSYNLSEQFI